MNKAAALIQEQHEACEKRLNSITNTEAIAVVRFYENLALFYGC
jgi:hypothetical protein